MPVLEISEERKRSLLFILLFFIIMSLSNFLSIVATGIIQEARFYSFRYLWLTLLVPGCFGWVFFLGFVEHCLPSGTKILLAIRNCSYVALAVIITPYLFQIDQLKKLDDYYPDFVKCMDANCVKRGLSMGIAHYWQARPITMLSKSGVRVVQVHRDLSIFYHGNNLDWYKNGEPQFVVVDHDTESFQFDKSAIVRRFGEPADVFRCGNSDVLVYNRVSDCDFRRMLKEQLIFGSHLDKAGDELQLQAKVLPGQVGNIVGQSRSAEEVNGSGFVSFGPYVVLSPGFYAFEIDYFGKTDNEKDDVGTWDVGQYSKNYRQLKQGWLMGTGSHVIHDEFKIDKMYQGEPIEVRTYYNGKGLLTVHSIKLIRLK